MFRKLSLKVGVVLGLLIGVKVGASMFKLELTIGYGWKIFSCSLSSIMFIIASDFCSYLYCWL